MLCASPSPLALPGVGSQAREAVIRTYETLVSESPSLAEQNRLLRIEARSGQNALVPAIVATPAFYNRTAKGDPVGYVTLAAATLDQFPSQAEIDRLSGRILVQGARPQVLNRVVLSLNPPGSKSPQPAGPTNPLYRSLQQDVLINADYYGDTPSILGASLGFTNILGVPGLGVSSTYGQALARRAGGSWETLSSSSAGAASLRAYTSDAAVSGIATNYGYPVKYTDGFPIEFSWPVLPSSVSGDDFRVVLNTGQVVTPLAASITPNFEYNERSTVVILGYFGNRIAPGRPGAIYPVKLEVARSHDPLKLVGPGGVVVSAAGLAYGDGSTPMTAYNPGSGPKLVGAKLSVMSTAGESAPAAFSGSLPNDGVSLYGSAAQYRLRVFTSGGFSPDGVRSVYPTDFSRFFRIETVDADGEVRWLTQTGVPYQLPSGTITVVGLADLGPVQASYDDSYVEDHDNQIDIVLSGDEAAIATIKAVQIPASGAYSPFYNPGGPGNDPTPGVVYSQPGPSLTQPVIQALVDPMTVTYIAPRAAAKYALHSRSGSPGTGTSS
ncbi:hypothetical protein [Paludisphaera soli]|uniref:hypothetical protein n=1 Tax=Paludisphaera soli TaxID=2712865 RepID=UPI0013EC88D0|nr:hypothetical protein [Paludisphaera soli]